MSPTTITYAIAFADLMAAQSRVDTMRRHGMMPASLPQVALAHPEVARALARASSALARASRAALRARDAWMNAGSTQ